MRLSKGRVFLLLPDNRKTISETGLFLKSAPKHEWDLASLNVQNGSGHNIASDIIRAKSDDVYIDDTAFVIS